MNRLWRVLALGGFVAMVWVLSIALAPAFGAQPGVESQSPASQPQVVYLLTSPDLEVLAFDEHGIARSESRGVPSALVKIPDGDLSRSHARAIAVHPRGRYLYLAVAEVAAAEVVDDEEKGDVVEPGEGRGDEVELDAGRLWIVDVTDRSLRSVELGAPPIALAVHPSEDRVYVTTDGGIEVVDAENALVVSTIAVPDAAGIAVDASGELVYVTTFGEGGVTVIDTASEAVVATIPTRPAAAAVVLDFERSRAYVLHGGGPDRVEAGVSTIDTAGYSVASTMWLAARSPSRLASALARDVAGIHLYVAVGRGVWAIELPLAGEESSPEAEGSEPRGASFESMAGPAVGLVAHPSGDRFYVAFCCGVESASGLAVHSLFVLDAAGQEGGGRLWLNGPVPVAMAIGMVPSTPRPTPRPAPPRALPPSAPFLPTRVRAPDVVPTRRPPMFLPTRPLTPIEFVPGTPEPTETPSGTGSPTETPVGTPGLTETPVGTPGPTETPSVLPIPAATTSATPFVMETPLSTPAPTETSSTTPAPTPTPTGTLRVTPTPSSSPMPTTTASPTATSTPTPLPSISLTPSAGG